MGTEHLEFVLKIEDAFSITVSNDEAFRLVTAGDAYDLIAAKLHASERALDSDALWSQVTDLILATGNFRDKGKGITVTRSMKLIDDLGWG